MVFCFLFVSTFVVCLLCLFIYVSCCVHCVVAHERAVIASQIKNFSKLEKIDIAKFIFNEMKTQY